MTDTPEQPDTREQADVRTVLRNWQNRLSEVQEILRRLIEDPDIDSSSVIEINRAAALSELAAQQGQSARIVAQNLLTR
jgi:hypothetical protein